MNRFCLRRLKYEYRDLVGVVLILMGEIYTKGVLCKFINHYCSSVVYYKCNNS